jgi:uncharacterized protein (TIGR02391 family)
MIVEARKADFIPPAEQAIDLPVPELAVRLLAYLVALEDAFGGYGAALNAPALHPDAVGHAGTWPEHATGPDDLFLRAMGEAWAWLIAHGLLARQPGGGPEMFVTRAGRAVATRPDGPAFLQAEQRLGVELHPRIAGKVRSQFLLGDPETAVLVAMKAVEIRVRALGGFPDSLIGVKLMQEAFKAENREAARPAGPLANPELDGGEQFGWMQLFCGAIAMFKNPSSHRQVDYDDPTVAAEVILLADLLLRLLDDIAAQQAAHLDPGGP